MFDNRSVCLNNRVLYLHILNSIFSRNADDEMRFHKEY